MSSVPTFPSGKSLHYNVKAFLFSVPVEVKRDFNEEGLLKKIEIFSSLKIPPGIGRRQNYNLVFLYESNKGDSVHIHESWGDRQREKVAPLAGHLDLAKMFFGGDFDKLTTSAESSPIVWLGADIYCRDLKSSGNEFSFHLMKSGKVVASLSGEMGGEGGVLEGLKIQASKDASWLPRATITRLKEQI